MVAFALIGIVTMQLGLLKLNAGIGRALEHEAALQREDSVLSVENSEVAAGDTVELQAAHMGMQLIPAGALRFLPARGSTDDVGKALQALNARVATPKTPSTESTATASTASAPAESASTESGSTEAASTEAASTASTSAEAATPTQSTTPAAAPSAGYAQTTEGTAASSTPAQAPAQTAPTGESGGAAASPGG